MPVFRKVSYTTLILFLVLVPLSPAFPDDEGSSDRPELPTVPLMDLLNVVSKSSKKEFLIDHRVHPRVVIGTGSWKNFDYEDLLAVLRNNDLAAVDSDGRTSVIPVSIVRQFPLPVISDGDAHFADEEWVTMTIELKNQRAAMFVPIVRPLLPQAGHMAAHETSRTLIIVDRYGNVKRIAAMVREMDSRPVWNPGSQADDSTD